MVFGGSECPAPRVEGGAIERTSCRRRRSPRACMRPGQGTQLLTVRTPLPRSPRSVQVRLLRAEESWRRRLVDTIDDKPPPCVLKGEAAEARVLTQPRDG